MDHLADEVDGIDRSAQSTPESVRSASTRYRHSSGSPLSDIEPIPADFTQEELDGHLESLKEQKVSVWRLKEHLKGIQIVQSEPNKQMSAVRNFYNLDGQAVDTGNTALHWACTNNYNTLVNVLLNHCHVNVELANKKGATAIHLAISENNHKAVEMILDRSRLAVSSLNRINGFYPLHTAAYSRNVKISKLLLSRGATVETTTCGSYLNRCPLSVFHIAAYKYAKTFSPRTDGDYSDDELVSEGISPADKERLKNETFGILSLYLDNLIRKRVRPAIDSKHGSALHYFAAINFAEGISRLAGEPFFHDPDLENESKVTPLLIAASHQHLESVEALLEFSVNVNHVNRHCGNLTALELLIRTALRIKEQHLGLVQKLLDCGADPTVSHSSDYSAVHLAIDLQDVRLLAKFLDYLDRDSVNSQDKDTGYSLLHYCVAKDDVMAVRNLLSKGADVMKQVLPATSSQHQSHQLFSLPVHIALVENTSESYFQALQDFGLNRIVADLQERYGGTRKLIEFLQVHLSALVLERNKLLQEFYTFLKVFGQDKPADLAEILHYTGLVYPSGSVGGRTPLSWANENGDQINAIELLKLEKEVHEGEREGLKCIKNNLSGNALLPWIINTYTDLYDNPSNSRWVSAIFNVAWNLLFLSYLPYIYDLYTDIDLLTFYGQAMNSNRSQLNADLWTCFGEPLDNPCYGDGTYDVTRRVFQISYWLTLVVMLVSAACYFFCVFFIHSNSRTVKGLQGKLFKYMVGSGCPEVVSKSLAFLTYYGLVFISKLFWPLHHFVRRVRYEASNRRAKYKEGVAESDNVWMLIKKIEYGLEACFQLLLQILLCVNYLGVILNWSNLELEVVKRTFRGVGHFLLFGYFSACFVDKMMAKILFSFLFLTVSVTNAHTNKHGYSLTCKQAVPIFLFNVCQISGRLIAFSLFLEMKSGLHYYKAVLFFGIHYLCVAVIKLFLEFSPPATPQGRKPSVLLSKDNLFAFVKFFSGVLSSSIVLVRFDLAPGQKAATKNSLLPRGLFQFLLLLEHLVIVIMFALSSESDLEYGTCTPAYSRDFKTVSVVVLWLLSLFFLYLHYNMCHLWAPLNGPDCKQLEYDAVVCFKIRNFKSSRTPAIDEENKLELLPCSQTNRSDSE